MTREQIFQAFNINETHNKWDNSIDNWYLVEIYRIMKCQLPPPEGDTDCTYVLEFLYKFKNDVQFNNEIKEKYQQNWGSLFLTAKRSVYSFIEYLEHDENVDNFFESIKNNTKSSKK